MTRTRKRAAPAPAPAPAAASGFGALCAGDAHTVLQLLLPKLPVFERARAAAVNHAWRDAASAPAVWTRVNLDGCAKTVDVRALVAMCTRAGAALTDLSVTNLCPLLTTDALLYALVAGGCVNLRTLTLPQNQLTLVKGLSQLWLRGVAGAQAVRRACPALEKLTATLLCIEAGDIEAAAQVHPKASYYVILPPALVPAGVEDVRRTAALRHPSVSGLAALIEGDEDGLTEEQAVALAELALPSDDAELRVSSEDGRPACASPLSDLQLRGTVVGDATTAVIADALRAPDCALRLIDLSAGALTDAGVSLLADALASNKSLHLLHLHSHGDGPVRLADGTASAMAAAMRLNRSLRVLELTGKFSSAACGAFFSAITGHVALRVLRLNNNDCGVPLDGAAGAALGGVLRAPGRRLQCLTLCFHGGYAPDGSAALGAGLAESTSLRTLHLRARLGETSPPQRLALAQALKSALLVNTKLTSLSMLGLDLDGRAAAALAPALAVHPSLTDVDFSFNLIGDAGAIALAQALAAPTCACVELDVRYCDIGGRGGEALADALRSNTCLKELDASNNHNISNDSMGSALRANTASRLRTLAVDQTRALSVLTKAVVDRGLTSLMLNGVQISATGEAATLAAMLSQPRCALRKLRLALPHPHDLFRFIMITLASGLSRNTSLTWLKIENCVVQAPEATTLGRALCGHPRLAALELTDCAFGAAAAAAAAPSLLRALCATDGDGDDGDCIALALLRVSLYDGHCEPLSDEELADCHALAAARQPYPLTLIDE